MGKELVPASQIMHYVNKGNVESEVAVEDVPDYREKWSAGDKRDQRVVRAIDAIEEGRQLVDLHKVIGGGGTGAYQYFPHLAVAPVGVSTITGRVTKSTGTLIFIDAHHDPFWFAKLFRWKKTFHWTGLPPNINWMQRQAHVPIIPPDIRARTSKGDLVLWEATCYNEKVSQKIDWAAHIDPAILEPVVGSLYCVKATWDLTELEAAALR